MKPLIGRLSQDYIPTSHLLEAGCCYLTRYCKIAIRFIIVFAIGCDGAFNQSEVKKLRYGSAKSQFSELRIPKLSQGPHPVIIIIHGGCWEPNHGLDMTVDLAEEMTRRGFATLNIEYRRIGKGGEWPNMFQDIAAASDSLQDVSAEFNLDLDRVIVVGHSAGGHLALWLAGSATLPPKSPLFRENPISIKGVMSLAGIPDLRSSKICSKETQNSLIGLNGSESSAERDVRFAQTSPLEMLPIDSPITIVVAGNDEIIPPSQATDYIHRAKALGILATRLDITQLSHLDIIDPSINSLDLLMKQVEQMLAQ